MAKNSTHAILYTILAIGVAGLLAWLWHKHAAALSPIAQLQASVRATQANATVAPSGAFSTSLVSSPDMSVPLLTNTSGNGFFGSAPL